TALRWNGLRSAQLGLSALGWPSVLCGISGRGRLAASAATSALRKASPKTAFALPIATDRRRGTRWPMAGRPPLGKHPPRQERINAYPVQRLDLQAEESRPQAVHVCICGRLSSCKLCRAATRGYTVKSAAEDAP